MKIAYRSATLATLAALAVVLCSVSGTAYADPVLNSRPADIRERLQRAPKTIVLDVRTQEEYVEGHLANAVLVPIDRLDATVESILKDHGATTVVYCATGGRSSLAVKKMSAKGYTHLINMVGGITAWSEMGYPVTTK